MKENQGKSRRILWRIWSAEILRLAVSDIFRKNQVNVKEKQIIKWNKTYSDNNNNNNNNTL